MRRWSLEISVIDLKVFARKYRQALLYTMIEGLNEGAAFSFSDDRASNEIEAELVAAGLEGYRWARKEGLKNGDTAYLIERKYLGSSTDSCCGCCGAEPKVKS